MGAVKVKHAGAFQAIGGATGPWYSQLPGIHHSTGVATASPDATAHVKGAWTQLVASTAATTTALLVRVSDVAKGARDTAALLDIGVGVSGSESAVINNVAIGGADSLSNGGVFFMVPIRVASGSRISARIQAVASDISARVEVWAYNVGDANMVPTSVDVLGTSTTTSEGKVMSGAAGTYVQITSSTSQSYKAIVIVPSTTNNSQGTTGVSYTVAVGAAGSEIDLGNIVSVSSTNETMRTFPTGRMAVFSADIPAGSRLSVKHDLSGSPDKFDVTLIGIPAV